MPTDENTPDWTTMDGDELAEYIIDHPDFADQGDLGKLDGSNWSRLLTFQPSFASKCDWDNWMAGIGLTYLKNNPILPIKMSLGSHFIQ